jgi:hypothetical protein
MQWVRKATVNRYHAVKGSWCVAIALIGFAMTFGCDAFGQEASSEPKTSAARIGQVTETLILPKTGGGSEKVLVELNDWLFDPGDTDISMPSGGATIVAVSNGAVSVTMDGATKAFDTGDYWSVPSGSKLTVTVHPPARAAILRTITGAPAP